MSTAMSRSSDPVISILIKTFNEEVKIGRAIESSLKALAEAGVAGEVIVADSLSTDGTVAVAGRYPVLVVQMENPADRGCGAGVQLGYQFARGRYVYFLDGDMELVQGFLPHALHLLQEDDRLAGVAGILEDVTVNNAFDRIRVNNRAFEAKRSERRLTGGGLYRRAAITEAAGYAGNRNLKGYEEAELGMRLRAFGWKLVRCKKPSVRHRGHARGAFELFVRHWRSGRAMSAGALLRSALGKRWWLDANRELWHPIIILAWWISMPFAWMTASGGARWGIALGWPVAVLAVGIILAIRKRDIVHASTSVCHWHYGALAILIGFFYRQRSPLEPIAAKVISDRRAESNGMYLADAAARACDSGEKRAQGVS